MITPKGVRWIATLWLAALVVPVSRAGGVLTYSPVRITSPATLAPNFDAKIYVDSTVVPVLGTVIVQVKNNAATGPAVDQDWYYLDGQNGVPDRDGPVYDLLTFDWQSDEGSFGDYEAAMTFWQAPDVPGVYTISVTVKDTGYVREDGWVARQYHSTCQDVPANGAGKVYTQQITVVGLQPPYWPWYSDPWLGYSLNVQSNLTRYPGNPVYYVANPNSYINMSVRDMPDPNLYPRDFDYYYDWVTNTVTPVADFMKPVRWLRQMSDENQQVLKGTNQLEANLWFQVPPNAKWLAVDGLIDDNPSLPERDDWLYAFRHLIVSSIDVSSPPVVPVKTFYRPAPASGNTSDPPVSAPFVEVPLLADAWWNSATRDVVWKNKPTTPLVQYINNTSSVDQPIALFYKKDTTQSPPVYTLISLTTQVPKGGNSGIVVVWTGLPVLNQTFNQIFLQATLQAQLTTQRQMKLFFNPTLKDHPSGANFPNGRREPFFVEGGNYGEDWHWPNWFYYWRQTAAGRTPAAGPMMPGGPSTPAGEFEINYWPFGSPSGDLDTIG